METEESLGETEEKKRFRELLYSSLLQQRQETEYATPLFDIGKSRERSVSWSPQ